MAIKILKSSDQGAPQSAAVGWRVATALPPFQMFAAERMRTKTKAIGRAKARWGV